MHCTNRVKLTLKDLLLLLTLKRIALLIKRRQLGFTDIFVILEKSHLSLFLRFITGSECLAPSVTIKVNYVNQEHKCPTVQTCFKILSLSRQYNRFLELRDSLNKVIESHKNWSGHDAELEESSFE